MSASNTPVVLDDVHTLVDLVELKDVKVMGLSGTLHSDPEVDAETEFELSFAPAFRSSGFRTRFKIDFNDGTATFMADIAAHWEFPHPVRFTADAVIEFAERVAFMTVYPYLRESIATTAARMNQPVPTLGLIKPNHFSLGADRDSLQQLIDKSEALSRD